METKPIQFTKGEVTDLINIMHIAVKAAGLNGNVAIFAINMSNKLSALFPEEKKTEEDNKPQENENTVQ